MDMQDSFSVNFSTQIVTKVLVSVTTAVSLIQKFRDH